MALTDRACSSCQSALPADAQFCMRCGTATPTEPGVPPRTQSTGAFEVAQVTQALAGRYRIERVLGEGGMATVYLAEDLKHQRQVAVKVMRPELAATLGADRFLREVQIAAKLNHPNILTMHDSGAADGLLYYVMPYVEGETLKDRLVRDGALPPEEALRLAREIAEALGYAHKRGIVHRDIKPANILLNEGHALVADFGIARAVEDGGESLTRTGLAVGTPQYMAPEQATGEKAIDGRADIYATGAILYEMLAGQTPFTGASARAILTKSLTEKPAPLPQVRPGLAPILDTVVQKALAKGVEERYASATEFVAAIDAARTPSSASQEAMPAVQATQVVAAAPAARGFGGLLSARNLIIAGLAAVALFFALRGRDGAPSPAATQPRGNRLAVLPFRNEGLPVNAAVTDGVVEDLRRRLGNVSALTVIGASSVSEYRNTDKPPATIGQDLKVDYLLTGTVRWDGEGAGRRAAMDTRLLDSRSGEELWGETVTVADAELPELPIKAAKGVLAALAVTPSSVELARVDSPLTRNAEAYRSYVRGQQAYLNETIDGPGLRGVIQELEQAVAIDAQFGDAWTLLSRANAFLFLNGNRDPANAARARQALERAEALQPGAPSVHAAKAGYLLAIAADAPAASAELDLALRGAPNDARLLRQSGASDLGRGDLGSALTKLERTRELDPRDPSTLASLVQVYVNLGRAAEAKEIGATLLAVAPLDLINVSQVVKAYLSDGDVAGAQSIMRATMDRGVPPPRLAAHMTGFYEVGWALPPTEQEMVLRLSPSAFDNDRAWWGQSLATLHWQRGDTAAARAFADSALAPTRTQVAASPDDAQNQVLLSLLLAYTGRAAEARALIASAVDRAAQSSDPSYIFLNAVRAEAALGDKEATVTHLKRVLDRGYFVSPAWLRIDPTFAFLKGHPAFEQLLQGK